MTYIPTQAKLKSTPSVDPETGDEIYRSELEEGFIVAVRVRVEKGELENLEEKAPEIDSWRTRQAAYGAPDPHLRLEGRLKLAESRR